jgi:glycosyltransferase involved in cell wall biosynthesis
LVLAPFARGLGHGGSQRATAVAERLEERGVAVDWQLAARRTPTAARKLRALSRRRPLLAELYGPMCRRFGGDPDAVLIAHSYLVPAAASLARGVPRIVDFHNLEWCHLADGTGSGRVGAGIVRAAYVRRQVELMRRLERSIVAGSDLSLFVSEDEHRWARDEVPGASTLRVGSVLPRSAEQAAAAISHRRDPRRGELAYVGTLTFPTNLASLERFLATAWPAMRAAAPNLNLTIAGACGREDRARLERHPGVSTLGFVPDLTPLLARCDAAVMPFDGFAGTSLRALFYALAGVPVIGSPLAFRGIDFPAGIVAHDPAGWAAAISQISEEPAAVLAIPRDARLRARAHQDDPRPWDRLRAAIDDLSGSEDCVSAGTPAAGAGIMR